MVDSRLKWDINFISFDVFGTNNYVYFPAKNFSLYKLIDGTQKDIAPMRDRFSPKLKSAYLNTVLNLPSVMVSIPKHAFAFHMSGRANLNAYNVAPHIAKFGYEGLTYTPLHDTDLTAGRFSAATMGWAEIGFSYSGILYQRGREFYSWGVNVNMLKALAGAYVISNSMEYYVPNADTILVKSAEGELGYAVPNGTGMKVFAGSGTGFDIGFCYEKKQPYEWSPVFHRSLIKSYKYRISATILDLGSVKMGGVSDVVQISASSAVIPVNDFNGIGSASGMDVILNHDLNKSTETEAAQTNWTMSLPSAASFQFDYNIKRQYYVNGAFIYNLTNPGKNLVRMKQLAICPRYESKWFEFAMPLSMYDLRDPHLGFAFRFNCIYIGSDHLLPLLGIGSLTGGNIYFGIKITQFKEQFTGRDKSAYLNSSRGIFRPFWRMKF